MSAVTRPRGPLPARVYWTRRLLVLGVALLLVAGLARLLGGGSDASSGPDDTAAQVAGTPTGSATNAAPTTRATRPVPTKKRKKATPTPTPLAQPQGSCTPEQVTVDPLIQRAVGGSAIRIVFELSTPEPACTFTFSGSSVAVKIISGKDRIWTSQQCRTLPTHTDLVVRAEKPVRVAMRWSGRRSNQGCRVAYADWAEAGYYHVVAATLGGEPSDQQFRLVNPSRKTVTRAPKPQQKDEKSGSQPTEEPTGNTPSGATEPS